MGGQWIVHPHTVWSPITILRSNLIDSSYQTSHSRNQLKAKQEEDNGDHPTHDFKLPLQNYCQHNAGTISNWAVQSGCDGGQDPLHLWPAWSQHHWGDGWRRGGPEAEQALTNIGNILAAAGGGF